MRDTGILIAEPLDVLIEDAPLLQLRVMLRSCSPPRVRRSLSGVALSDLAAGFVLGLLAAGAAMGRA